MADRIYFSKMGNDIRILQCLLQFIKFLRDELRVIK